MYKFKYELNAPLYSHTFQTQLQVLKWCLKLLKARCLMQAVLFNLKAPMAMHNLHPSLRDHPLINQVSLEVTHPTR